jgi:hypothetical protein
MKSIFLTISLLLLTPVQLQAKDWRVESGELQYTLRHVLHNTIGISREVTGQGKCTATCLFTVAAPVKSFDSKNSGRDTKMLAATKAEAFPIVEIKTTLLPAEGDKTTDIEVSFAGKQHTYAVQLTFIKNDIGFKVQGKIPLLLSDFDVERPGILGVKTDDLVPVVADLQISQR